MTLKVLPVNADSFKTFFSFFFFFFFFGLVNSWPSYHYYLLSFLKQKYLFMFNFSLKTEAEPPQCSFSTHVRCQMWNRSVMVFPYSLLWNSLKWSLSSLSATITSFIQWNVEYQMWNVNLANLSRVFSHHFSR